MGSVHPPKNSDYDGDKTRIDMTKSYQVAYWKERFGVSEKELGEAVRTAGALARRVEKRGQRQAAATALIGSLRNIVRATRKLSAWRPTGHLQE